MQPLLYFDCFFVDPQLLLWTSYKCTTPFRILSFTHAWATDGSTILINNRALCSLDFTTPSLIYSTDIFCHLNDCRVANPAHLSLALTIVNDLRLTQPLARESFPHIAFMIWVKWGDGGGGFGDCFRAFCVVCAIWLKLWNQSLQSLCLMVEKF